jgi:hypothetical protein
MYLIKLIGGNMPVSRIKSDLQFEDSEYVVFLVNIEGTQHAFLLIEGAATMIRCDYGANASASKVLSQTLSSMHRRILGVFFPSAQSSTIPGGVSIATADLNEFIELAQGNQLQYQHWIIDSIKQQNLLTSINKEILNPPDYGLNGDRAPIGSGYPNCLTWSIDKLKEIDLTVMEHWSHYVLVAKPSTVNKPTCVLI